MVDYLAMEKDIEIFCDQPIWACWAGRCSQLQGGTEKRHHLHIVEELNLRISEIEAEDNINIIMEYFNKFADDSENININQM